MEKKILEDITAPAHKKRSIRDIPIPATRKNNSLQQEKVTQGHEINLKKEKYEDLNDDFINKKTPQDLISEKFNAGFDDDTEEKRPRGRKKKIAFFIIIIFLGLFFLISLFEKATVTIYPKKALAEIDETLNIVENDSLNSEFELGYRKLEFSREEEIITKATGEEKVSEKASGEITVFNEFTEKSQRLIKNTRFESPDGKIYRVLDSIEVPGFTEENGKIIPGKLDITVYAENPGEDYNIGKVDFTIPGFKGQEQFDYFYAKSKTDIQGGFDGIRKIISESDLEQAKNNLQNKLKENIIKDLQEQLPKNLVAIYSDDLFTFSDPIQENSGSDELKIKMTGNLSAKVIDKSQLSKKLAEKNLNEYRRNEEILITNIDELEINYLAEEEMSIHIKGEAKFEWQNDENLLLESLLGIERSKTKDVFSGFSGISKGEVLIFPPWKSSFPDKKDDIDINVKHPYED